MLYLVMPAAAADLQEIWDYIAEDSEAAATRYLQTIRKEFAALARMPDAGAVRSELTSKAVRFWLVGPNNSHFVIYNPTSMPVEILRVLHTARNAKRILRGR